MGGGEEGTEVKRWGGGCTRLLRMLAGPFGEVLVTKELRVRTLWSFAAEHTDPPSTARADTMNY